VSRIDFYRHDLGEEELEALRGVLESLFLTTGPRTEEFERAFAEYLGTRFAVGVMSCTSALFLSLKALGVGPGDEVITTPMTFIASSTAILHTGARPAFVDVEPDTGNLDATRLGEALTDRTRAVLPVHLYGQMVDMRTVREFADENGLYVVEDAAHAAEAARDGVRPAQLSDAACFSFYAVKNLTSGEGGAVATRRAEIDEKLRNLRLHGMTKGAYDRYSTTYRHWDMTALGYKANMSDLQAALLLCQIPRIEERMAKRERLARRYEAALRQIDGVEIPVVRDRARSALHLYTIWVAPERRDEILTRLQEAGVGVAVNYRAIHLLSYFRDAFGFERGMFPNAERIGDRTISLPFYVNMSDADVEQVVEALARIIESPPS